MNLDARINKMSDILTCVNTEEAKKYIGQKGFFADHLYRFEDLDDLSNAQYDTLDDVEDNNDLPFLHTRTHWRYFLPKSSLNKPIEKKYRPYTIEDFEMCEFVTFREKGNPSMEYHVRYNGYRKYDNVYKVILGNISYLLNDLFEDFEYLDSDGNWKPFGVEE